MDVFPPGFEVECRAKLDQFFAAYPDALMQQRAMKLLRLLRTSEKPVKGKADGWAAGIIYAIATDGRQPCGVPGLLNADFEQVMGVTMSTTRYGAARIMELCAF